MKQRFLVPIADWWKKTFTASYFDSYAADFTPAQTEAEVEFLIRALHLKKHHAILDLACGQGRHSIELATRGYQITGIDISETSLQVARQNAREKGVHVVFMQQDMRRLTFSKPFDVIFCLFTSFGYFSHTENVQTLKQIARTLKPNGKFLLDMYDYQHVFDKFKKHGERIDKTTIFRIVSDHWKGNVHFHDEQYFDFGTHVEHTRRIFSIGKEKKSYDLYLTFYTLEEYQAMLTLTGLSLTHVWGEFDGSSRTNTTTRTILLAQKI